jgi:hypothetical protein
VSARRYARHARLAAFALVGLVLVLASVLLVNEVRIGSLFAVRTPTRSES